MKLYLSSFRLGDESEKLKELMPASNRKIAVIDNALDFKGSDPEKRKKGDEREVHNLEELGLEAEVLDLKNYFGKEDQLRKKLNDLGGVWVRGGNTFVLRQAMRLSGFDNIFKELQKRDDFLYAGYSAGICVLAPDMRSLQIVDYPETPYKELKEIIWEGLGFLDYIILPHYDSDHPESADIDKEVEFCKKNNIPFKTLRDGEVIIIE